MIHYIVSCSLQCNMVTPFAIPANNKPIVNVHNLANLRNTQHKVNQKKVRTLTSPFSSDTRHKTLEHIQSMSPLI